MYPYLYAPYKIDKPKIYQQRDNIAKGNEIKMKEEKKQQQRTTRNGENGKQIHWALAPAICFPYFHLITIKINLCALFVIFTRIMVNDCNVLGIRIDARILHSGIHLIFWEYCSARNNFLFFAFFHGTDFFFIYDNFRWLTLIRISKKLHQMHTVILEMLSVPNSQCSYCALDELSFDRSIIIFEFVYILEKCWSLSSVYCIAVRGAFFFLQFIWYSFVCSFWRSLLWQMRCSDSVPYFFSGEIGRWTTVSSKYFSFRILFWTCILIDSVWLFISSTSFRFVWLKLIFINDLFLLHSKLKFFFSSLFLVFCVFFIFGFPHFFSSLSIDIQLYMHFLWLTCVLEFILFFLLLFLLVLDSDLDLVMELKTI